MKVSFSVTGVFEKEYKRLLKKYPSLRNDLTNLQDELSINLVTGSDLGGGFRKIRLAVKSKGKGKSGGARIITYDLIVNASAHEILFVSIYDKSETASIDLVTLRKIIADFT